jgi:hypothetical protein
MNMPLSGLPERRAALLVHALPAADRAWLLDALPNDQKTGLLALVQELHDMNVAPDAQWLQSWLPPGGPLETAVAPPPVSPAWGHDGGTAYDTHLTAPAEESARRPNPPADLMALGPAQLSELARLLGQEPLALTLRFLQLRPWPWRDRLLAQMNATVQMQLRQALRDIEPGWDQATSGLAAQAPAGASLDHALLASIARRLGPAAAPMAPRSDAAGPRPESGRWLATLWRGFMARQQPGAAR